MKKLIYLFVFVCSAFANAQQFNKTWDDVVALEKDGLTKKAARQVQSIYKIAKRNGDETQVIKCFFYQSKYWQVLEEDAHVLIINNLKKQIAEAKKKSSIAILNYIYAECLQQYRYKNYYKIYKRTAIDSVNAADIKTWTIANFDKTIFQLYNKSLENKTILKQTPLANYDAIFDFEDGIDLNQISLYNYLTQQVIAYYNQSTLSYYKDTTFSSEIEKQFYAINFKSFELPKTNKDTSLVKIMELYEELENNNATTKEKLRRIQYFRKKLFKYKADDEYLKAINNLKKQISNKAIIQEIQYENAQLLQYKANKKQFPNCLILATKTLDSIIATKSHTPSYYLALSDKKQLTRKEVSVSLKQTTYQNQNTRAHITFKNVENIKITFYKIADTASFNNNNSYYSKYNSKYKKDSIIDGIIKNQKPEHIQLVHLPTKNDYFSYTTEIMLDKLPLGNFLVYVTPNDADKEDDINAYTSINISNLALLSYQKNNVFYYQVVHSQSGKPIADVQVLSNKFNLKTDSNGLCSIKHDTKINYNYIPIKLIKDNDTLYYSNRNYNNYFDEYSLRENNDGKITFFLDRAIYRPGQTVYYKGIATQNKNGITSVVANTSFRVIVEDANNQEILKKVLKTNEFGSFTGELVLPKNTLTGDFMITAEEPNEEEYSNDIGYNKKEEEHVVWDNVDFDYEEFNFKVEEYKRPKFEVTFDKITASLVLNKEVKVTGKATTFAGSNISDAKVVYKITRNTYRHYWDYYSNDSLEVVQGETQTDANGNFSVLFIPEPNPNNDKNHLPVYEYEITADITDINGETQSNFTKLKVGYHALELSLDINKKIETKNQNKVFVNSQNLNGEFVATKAILTIHQKEIYRNKFIDRVFENPEIETLTKEQFEQLFPYEVYNKKNIGTDGTLVYTQNINTAIDKEISLDILKKLESGSYTITITAKDIFDNEIKNTKQFDLNQSFDLKVTDNVLFLVEKLNKNPKKDGFISLKIKSNIPELYFSVNGFYQQKLFSEKNFVYSELKNTLTIPIPDDYTDNIVIAFETIFENQSFTKVERIEIPELKNEMTIAVETFRSKIEPNSQETWSFMVKENNKPIPAEVLASMYDASLDKFTQTDWKKLYFENQHNNNAQFKTNHFYQNASLSFQSKEEEYSYYNRYQQNFIPATELMWFGFDFDNSNEYSIEKYHKQLAHKQIPTDAKLVFGIVNDEHGNPLQGVLVSVEYTNRKVYTAIDGYFEIYATAQEELIFYRYDREYKTIQPKINEENYVSLGMDKNRETLNEVVVTNMGMDLAKKSLGYASMTVTSKEIIQGYPANVMQTLSGKVAGLNIISDELKDTQIIIRGNKSLLNNKNALIVVDGIITTADELSQFDAKDIITARVLNSAQGTALFGAQGANGVIVIITKNAENEINAIQTRKDFRETAFFYPQLLTDKSGSIKIQFTSPETFTKWKLRLLAHTKKANSSYLENFTITQKELMVLPNMPRFFREKDTITITTKISNLSNQHKIGVVNLQLFDASTGEKLEIVANQTLNLQNFSVAARGSTNMSWQLIIPEGLQGIQYKIIAKAGPISDGEENIIPVLTNNMLVTESIPIWVREHSSKEYVLENLKNNTSTTLRNHLLTLEYSSNPSWLAIQSLPYIIEYEHECAEQTFARFYGNTLATEIINSNPKIAEVFATWRKSGKPISKLNQNEELKSILIAETPWLLDSENEEEKKKNLAMLFDLEKMKTSLDLAFQKLEKKQKPSGGFSWFDGGYENNYITRHILAGLGHLEKLKISDKVTQKFNRVTQTAIPYLDNQFIDTHKKRELYYQNLFKTYDWKVDYSDLHYLYTRSFYLDKYPLSLTNRAIVQKYIETTKKDWLNYSLYEKALAALALYRFDEKESAKKIIASLKETSSNNEDWGMYWIANTNSWYWYQSNIETQALLIEAFDEVVNDKKSVNDMKVWLLKNRQTKNWSTTKATTEAVYALLLQGSDYLSLKDKTVFKIGNEKIVTKKLEENEKEAETGYVKMTWKTIDITPEMANLKVVNKSDSPGYGGLYWQYFEDLEKIKEAPKNNLNISKELYIKNENKLESITDKNKLKIGNLITVRLIITAKEDCDFVHLKDMRASCFEPSTVLSEYKWQDNLGYYQSTKDLATHFFFEEIKKGTYVLEYTMRVTNIGSFSNGITTIQSMYAPEYSNHSKGIRVRVE